MPDSEVQTVDREVGQFDDPYHSTIAFERFLKERGCFRDGTEVLDIGTGLGAPLSYFARQNPGVKFLGVDYQPERIAAGRELMSEKGLRGVELEVGDWFDLPSTYVDRFDGIFNIHTFCCFKKLEPALEALIGLNSRWIAFNSLFWPGQLDVLIHIRDHEMPHVADDNPNGDFNIFSLDRTAEFLSERGYEMTYEPFSPPADIPKPTDRSRGTYTMRTELSERTQFSGPVHLPWHFVVATRRD